MLWLFRDKKINGLAAERNLDTKKKMAETKKKSEGVPSCLKQFALYGHK